MSERRSFTVTITPEIVREASRGFVWRFFGWTGVGCVVAGLGFVLFYLTTGTFDWLAGFLAAVLLIFVLIFGVALFQRERLTLAKLKQMGSPEVRYNLDEDSFTATSSIGSTTMRWDAMKGIWRFPRFWLLFFDRATYVTVPVQGPSADDLAFIAAKIPLHDKRIK